MYVIFGICCSFCVWSLDCLFPFVCVAVEIFRLIAETATVILIIEEKVGSDAFNAMSLVTVLLVETQGFVTAMAFGWNHYFQLTFTSVVRTICCFWKNVKQIRMKSKYVVKPPWQHQIHDYLEF